MDSTYYKDSDRRVAALEGAVLGTGAAYGLRRSISLKQLAAAGGVGALANLAASTGVARTYSGDKRAKYVKVNRRDARDQVKRNVAATAIGGGITGAVTGRVAPLRPLPYGSYGMPIRARYRARSIKGAAIGAGIGGVYGLAKPTYRRLNRRAVDER